MGGKSGREQGRGGIAEIERGDDPPFMASTNSWDAEVELAPYNVSKAGVFLLAKTRAREFGRYGIHSNM